MKLSRSGRARRADSAFCPRADGRSGREPRPSQAIGNCAASGALQSVRPRACAPLPALSLRRNSRRPGGRPGSFDRTESGSLPVAASPSCALGRSLQPAVDVGGTYEQSVHCWRADTSASTATGSLVLAPERTWLRTSGTHEKAPSRLARIAFAISPCTVPNSTDDGCESRATQGRTAHSVVARPDGSATYCHGRS